MSFNRIMIALDDSPTAVRAFELGAALASQLEASVALVFVVDTRLLISQETGVPADRLREQFEQLGQETLQGAARRVTAGAAPWEFVRAGDPVREILAAAREWRADLLVLGTHARSGLARVFIGSTAEGVLRHSTCPVLIVPDRDDVAASPDAAPAGPAPLRPN
jgi:nucleotide-binding universal stress UspA family protein